ncbi:MAG: InlB B-repeat-containing protein, partial [Tissierellia bacterium]|nr:InlB B-repeat-containing protein [Tissierellia bacterium]
MRSIDPGASTPVHEYQFYKTKEDAINASSGTSTPVPVNVQKVKTHGKLEEPELVEINKKLFDGWYTTYNGEEQKIIFNEGYNVKENITLYVYPKYKDVSALFFAEGSIILGTATADNEKHITINDEPNVMRENKILKGWSLDPDIPTWEAVVAAGKNFKFKEDTDPTEVEGSVVVYAVLEKAYRINYDTDGGTNIDGYFLGKDEIYAKVPADPEKEGYTFDHWYVIEEKLNPATGQMEDTEITLTTKTVGGELVFDKEIKKSTVIYAKYTSETVKFGIVFMREKRPDQIKPGASPYEFLGYFSNHGSSANNNLQKTEGLSGSKIIFDDQSSSTPEQVTNLDKDQFQSYLEQTNNNRNLLKYASSMGIEEELLKGFHVNKEKTNEVDCILKGNGLTTKLVYLDRDTVNLRVYKSRYQTSGNLIEDENSSPDALGNFKYGESIKVSDANRGWEYLIDKFNKGQGKMLQNYKGSLWFTIAPFAVDQATVEGYTAYYMQRDGDSWKFNFVLANKPDDYSLLSVPIKLPLDKQNYTYNQSENWLKDAGTTEAMITDSLLPNKENPAISDTTGWWPRMSLRAEDYAIIDGYACINGVKSYNTSTGSPGYKDKLCNVAGVENTSSVRNKYVVAPVFYKKKAFNLRFESGMTGAYGPLTVSDIPYDSVLVGPPGPEGGDPNIPAKEQEIEEYLSRFIKAIIDPDTKEVTNYDEATKNADGDLFMGWYLDPGYMLPFEEHMPMPAHNMQVFAKWEPYTHYVKVHKLSKDSDGAENPNNIVEIEIEHDAKLSEQNPKLGYIIPAGFTEDDFLGWETYGDINTHIPSTDGEGTAFEYIFDNQVKSGFHLYPKWKNRKARVVYVFNYDNFVDSNHTPDRPLTEDELVALRGRLDLEGDYLETNRYYMSKYQYDIDTDLRLRDPLGMDAEGFINHPVPPAGTATEGKVFLGWKIYSRNYKNGIWTRADTNLYYYNSPFTIGRNNISYSTSSGNDDALGALFLVAIWGDKDAKTEIKLFANNEKTPEAVYFENNLTQNEGYTLPDVKTLTDSTNASLKFEKEGYQFKYWTTNRDASGIQFRNQQEILIDNDLVNQGANELYAQWMKLYDVTAEKEWKDDEGNTISNPPKVAVGLLRRVAVGPPYNPGFGSVGGFTQVPDSLKVLPDDAGPDGKLHWNVEGHNDAGERYAYITVELKPEGNYVSKFYNATSMDELGVWIDQEGHRKYQNVELGNGSDVDVFTSATMRSETNYNATTNIAEGYLFKLTNTKVNVPAPVVEQGYVDETSFDITPGLDPKDVVTKIIVTIPGENMGDPEIVLTLEKTANGSWNPSDTAYTITTNDTGKITIQLPGGRKLKKDEVIKAHAENKQEVKSKTNQMMVKDAEPSVKPDKPVQQVRDDGYNVVITSTIPTGTTPDPNTVYTLVDSSGNDIKDSNNQPIVGTVGTAGTITFKVSDGILQEDDQVKVRAEEPRHKPTLSDLSDPLD